MQRPTDADPELQIESPVDDDPVIAIRPDVMQLIDRSKEVSQKEDESSVTSSSPASRVKSTAH